MRRGGYIVNDSSNKIIFASPISPFCLYCSNIDTVWMSVLAVLTIQFARTIAMALTISDFTTKFANRFLLPIVKAAVPPEYQVSVIMLGEDVHEDSNFLVILCNMHFFIIFLLLHT
jgi:hypothetical protein